MRSRKKHTPPDESPIEKMSDLESYVHARKEPGAAFGRNQSLGLSGSGFRVQGLKRV